MRAAVLALLASVTAGTCAAADPAPPPVKVFARKAAFKDARISPLGTHLAVSIPSGEQTMLGVIDLRTRKVSATLRFTDGDHVAGFWWVGPERVVVSLARKFGPLDQPHLTGELYGINADGSGSVNLFGYRRGDEAYGWLLDPLPNDPESALVAVQDWRGSYEAPPQIYRLDIHTGQRKRVAVIPVIHLLDVATDRDGALRFAVGTDIKGEPQLLQATDTSTGWETLKITGSESINLHGVGDDPGTLYFTTIEPQDRACLREYATGKGFRELQCRPGGGDTTIVARDRRPIGYESEAGYPELRWYEPGHPDARFLQVLQKTFGRQRVGVTSHTLDGSKAVVVVESDRNPGDYYLVDRATKKAEYLVSRRDWVDAEAMTPVEPVSYRTRDGTEIRGFLTARAGSKTRGSPLVVMPHGGPHGIRDRWEWDAWAQLLASRGYAVLQVNFRGSGGFGSAFQSAGYRKWGTLMQDDIADGTRWAIAAGIAHPERVCVVGASYGGYSALMQALREPDLYRCAASFAGIYDLERHSSDSDSRDTRLGRLYLERVLGDDDEMEAQSPLTHLGRLKSPLFFAHGTEDERVTFAQAKLLRKALDKAGKPYEWMEFKGEGHGFYKDENHEAFFTRLLEFLDKHIGAAAGK